MATERLNVVALVSGGKDSFFSILHCLANGHRIVALANVHPPEPQASCSPITAAVPGTQLHGSSADRSIPHHGSASGHADQDEEVDLNSFMYQTVGHQVIPLYAAATGLPLFRQPIVGTTVQSGISYQDPRQLSTSSSATTTATRAGPAPDSLGSQSQFDIAQDVADETESLVPLLRAVIAAHPTANALCTGAILSTYQRTRIESVALRLGLVPLAYLWQYPVLPVPVPDLPGQASNLADPLAILPGRQVGGNDDAQLLRDMAAVGLEARIVKVASAGLDEDFLWENVASEKTITRIRRALRRFGGGGRGSVLGEGGEFETLVTDGPPALFRGRIMVGDADRGIVREGGGSTWLRVRDARVETKPVSAEVAPSVDVRRPELLDARFKQVLDELDANETLYFSRQRNAVTISRVTGLSSMKSSPTEQYQFSSIDDDLSIQEHTAKIVEEVRKLGDPGLIINTIIILRHMSDFPTINTIYGALFAEPNPPSRVTISCGALLPKGADIAIYVTTQPGLTPSMRQGLHVQSRSYWAPANIGPYSQAIVFPLVARQDGEGNTHSSDASKLVTIAGQIPLVPASMDLPQGPDSMQLSITLALQHLWRIGLEMQIQWWTSAVAYFPRTPTEIEMKQKALLAASAWQSAHLWSDKSLDEQDDDEKGPDLWDRKFNPQYMSLVSSDESDSIPRLPVWDRLYAFDEDDESGETSEKPLPYMFAAEVEELPRSAGVEWHAHRGLVDVAPGSIRTICHRRDTLKGAEQLELQHIVVDSAEHVYVHTTAAVSASDAKTSQTSVPEEALALEIRASLGALLENAATSDTELLPYLTYLDMTCSDDGRYAQRLDGSQAIIPCYSLWSPSGRRLQAVMVYQLQFTKVR